MRIWLLVENKNTSEMLCQFLSPPLTRSPVLFFILVAFPPTQTHAIMDHFTESCYKNDEL